MPQSYVAARLGIFALQGSCKAGATMGLLLTLLLLHNPSDWHSFCYKWQSIATNTHILLVMSASDGFFLHSKC